MAEFRGKISGSRGEATRLGTKKSGLTVEAASWYGKVVVSLLPDLKTGGTEALVNLEPHHGVGGYYRLYRGSIGVKADSPALDYVHQQIRACKIDLKLNLNDQRRASIRDLIFILNVIEGKLT